MSRDLFSQIISADPVEFKRRRQHPRGIVQSVSGNMATIVVGNDANGAQMVMEDVPIASGVTVAVDDFVEIGYDNGHPAAPYIAGGSANVSGSGEAAAGRHKILSASHTDSATGTVLRGDLIYGNSTPGWARLAKGAANSVLTCDGNDPSWSTTPTVAGLGIGMAGQANAVLFGAQASLSASTSGTQPTLGRNAYYDGAAWQRMVAGTQPTLVQLNALGYSFFQGTDAQPPVFTEKLRIEPDGQGRVKFFKTDLGSKSGYLYGTPNASPSCGLWFSGYLTTDVGGDPAYGEVGVWCPTDVNPAAWLWRDSGSLNGGLMLGGPNYITNVDAYEFMQISVAGTAADADGVGKYALINSRVGPIVIMPDSLNSVATYLAPAYGYNVDLGSATRPFRFNTLANPGGLRLQDAGTSPQKYLILGSDSTTQFTADRSLNLDLENADRILKLAGNLTVESASLVNQDLTSDAGPTFSSGLTITGIATFTEGLRLHTGIVALPATDANVVRVYRTGSSGGAHPFNAAGHLILQSRDVGATRSIIFVTGNPGVVQWEVDGAGVLTAQEGKNMAFGTTTGTKIGTAAAQKIGFHNATPVVQAAHIADATDAATAITRINAILVALENKGFLAAA